MSFGKDDILDALGLKTAGPADWLGPVAIGFGLGALVGAAVALALAPRPGSELRGELMERGRRAMGKARERIESELSQSGMPNPSH